MEKPPKVTTPGPAGKLNRDSDDSLSAASRALHIHELVSDILGYIYHDWVSTSTRDRSILACLTINSVWEAEASRYLWHRCGGNVGRIIWPRLRHLVAIQSERRQKYADLIQNLSFEREMLKKRQLRSAEDVHSKLANLTYPRLKVLQIATLNPASAIQFTSEILPMRQYFPPGLEVIGIHGHVMETGICIYLTDRLLLEMRSRCRNLRKLTIDLKQATSKLMTPTEFVLCIQELRALTSLTLKDELDETLTPDFFRSLAHHQSIQTFRSRLIPDHWIKPLVLDGPPSQKLFSQLQTLEVEISENGLNMLLPYLQELRHLKIRASEDLGPRSNHLRAFTGLSFNRLTEFQLGLPSGVFIYAKDLITFAKSVPNLMILELPEEGLCRAGSILCPDLTDGIIEDMTRHLPKITKFSLNASNPFVTGASLVSLGKYCRSLRYCRLHAKVNFSALANDTQTYLMPEIETVMIHNDSPGEPRGNPLEIAEKLVNLMPNLRAWQSDQDVELERVVKDMIDYESELETESDETSSSESDTEDEDESESGQDGGLRRIIRIELMTRLQANRGCES